MALFSKQYLEWELVFVASIPSQVDSHCILDAISPALPPDISYTLRTTRFLTDRSNGVRISRPTFLPDTLAHLHYQDVVFLNEKGVKSLKHTLAGLHAAALTSPDRIQIAPQKFVSCATWFPASVKNYYLC